MVEKKLESRIGKILICLLFASGFLFAHLTLATEGGDGDFGDGGDGSSDEGGDGSDGDGGGEPETPPEDATPPSGGDGDCGHGVDANGDPIGCEGENGPQQDGDGGPGGEPEDLSEDASSDNEEEEVPTTPSVTETYKPIGLDLEGLRGKAGSLNPTGLKTPQELVARIIKGALGIIGSISLVMFIYGGILFMTDRGSGEQSGKAREILVWTSLGLAVIFSAYALVDFIFEAFR